MYIIILKTLMLNISVMLNIKFFISIQIRKKDFCDVKYQFFFIFIFFANLKKKKRFLWCPISNFGRDTYSMICYEEFENPCTFVLKLMQRVLHCTNWQKKEREGGEKKLYICLQLLKDKKHQTLTKVSWQPVSLT